MERLVKSGITAFAMVAVLGGCDGKRDTATAKDAARDYVAQRAAAIPPLPAGVPPGSKAAQTYRFWQTAAAAFSGCAEIDQASSPNLSKEFVLQATLATLAKLDGKTADAPAVAAIGQLAGIRTTIQEARRAIVQRQSEAASAAAGANGNWEQLKQGAVNQFAVYAAAQIRINQVNAALETVRDQLYDRYGYQLSPIVIDKKSCLTPMVLLSG